VDVTARRPVVHVEPIDVDLVIEPGETIIEAAWRLGYWWPTACYGQAQCTLCQLDVLDGDENLNEVGDEERDVLEHHIIRGMRRDLSRLRLACRAQPTGDVTVHKEGVTPPEV
jgi:2Fe-2S ferredoxin